MTIDGQQHNWYQIIGKEDDLKLMQRRLDWKQDTSSSDFQRSKTKKE